MIDNIFSFHSNIVSLSSNTITKVQSATSYWLNRSIVWIKENMIDPIVQFFCNFFSKNDPVEEFINDFKQDTSCDHLLSNPISKKGKNGDKLKQLQSHLFEVVKKIRNQETVSMKDTFLTKMLFSENFIVTKNINTISLSLALAFENYDSPQPIVFPFKPQVLPPSLSPLPNIGNTCYLNATLRMMASTSSFDTLLNTPLNQPNEEFLRQHLKRIIDTIRTGKPVCSQEMKDLYSKIEGNGWEFDCRVQSDPQEFLSRIIFTKLNAGYRGLKVTDRKTWPTAEGAGTSLKHNNLYEIACAPIVDNSMESLIQGYLAEEVLQGFRPEGATEDAKKTSYVSEAPSTLFIQANRFSLGQKLNFDISVFPKECTDEVPEFKLPVYSLGTGSEEPKVNETCTYKLKSAICHLGASLNSGHYVVVIHEPGRGWIRYDDSTTIPLSISAAKALINKSGYYLSYERHSLRPSGPSVVPPESPPHVETEDYIPAQENHTAEEGLPS